MKHKLPPKFAPKFAPEFPPKFRLKFPPKFPPKFLHMFLAPIFFAVACTPTVDHVVKDIDGKDVSLASYRGKTLVVVNVASECGYTPQYAELQLLYDKYRDKGLVVLGFPSNDFGGQEPGDNAQIKKFASDEYGVTFPLFDKVHATGANIAPLYKFLTEKTDEKLRGPVKWNFTKFVVDPKGKVIARFESKTTPLDKEMLVAVESALPPG